MPAYELLDKNFRDIQLNQNIRVEYYTEFLELSRFRSEKSVKQQADFINHKYEINKPDVVIAVMSPALNFIQKYCKKTFINIPIIYALIDKEVDLGELEIKATGINLHLDLVKTLKAALSIQPKTRDVYVVVGTSVLGRSWQAQAEEAFRPFSSQLNFHYLSDLSMAEILHKVRTLPSQSIVMYLLLVKDASGNSFVPREALNQISQSSSVPVYGLWDTFIGYGIIGGHLCSFDVLGKKVSKMVARILEGENLETIPPITMGPNTHMFDWRQMKRFGIHRKTIPEESILLFKPQSAWSKYKFHIIAFILTTLIETFLILLLIVNIKKRQSTEKVLLIEKNRLMVTLRSIGDGVITTDTDGRLVLMNKVAEELTGWSQNEAVGKTIGEVFHIINSKTRQKCENRVEKVLKAKTIVGLANHTNLIGRDGTERMIADSGSPILNENGEIVGVVLAFRDITEKYRMEKQLQQSQKMEAIGTLAGGIAHDFNNILAVILGNAELAADDIPPGNPAGKSLKAIHQASIRAKDMVRQLLAFSRKSDEETKLLNMTPIIKESMKMLRSAVPTSVEFEQHISDDPCNILGDAAQINQIVMNLVTNAAHAMSEEGGLVEVTLENIVLQEEKICFDWVLSPGPYVRLRMRDTGEGIEPTIMNRIFEPYYTTKEVGKGTGMGLSVIHGIVKRHGGGIRVESELGKGTVFEIYFPALEKTIEKEKEPDGEIKGGLERILFVDDEASMVNLNRQRLERLGYQVKSTTRPLQALEWFSADPDGFDVIITDMTMPRLTGDRLAAEIMKIRPHMPVIICTGYSERMSAKKAKDLGVRKYIEKPIDLRNLASILREVLDETRS
jgi:two-component system, cell cycle sensor histidine kinase and response regulator CckA